MTASKFPLVFVLALLVASSVGAETPTTWTLVGDASDTAGGGLSTCDGSMTLVVIMPELLGTADSEFPAVLAFSGPTPKESMYRLSFTIDKIKPAKSGGWNHTATASPESARKIKALVRTGKDFTVVVRDPIGGETYALDFTVSNIKGCE